MSPSKPTPVPAVQPAAERRAAEAELQRLVTCFAPDQRTLVATVRRWLRQRLPTAHELVYEYRDCFVTSFTPNARGYDGVLAVRGSAEGVRLYLNRCKGLADPARLLQGTGGLVRWIAVESAATLKQPAVVKLVELAIARNTLPFPRTGKGRVILQSAPKQKASTQAANTGRAAPRVVRTDPSPPQPARARSRVRDRR